MDQNTRQHVRNIVKAACREYIDPEQAKKITDLTEEQAAARRVELSEASNRQIERSADLIIGYIPRAREQKEYLVEVLRDAAAGAAAHRGSMDAYLDQQVELIFSLKD